jgi:hypothetical protein
MESAIHISLCSQLKSDINRIAKKFTIKKICGSTAAAPTMPPPPEMCGFIPDFYAYTNSSCFALVGEAKTMHDILNKHTDAQVRAYIDYIQPFQMRAVLFRVENSDFFLLKRYLKNHINAFDGSFYINGKKI